MFNELLTELRTDEIERNAYNAAFYELGLRWHWDSETFAELCRHSEKCAERLHRYLLTQQPHLLRAYDAEFLINAIQQRKAAQRQSSDEAVFTRGHFDWAQARGAEIGV